jgi:twitching motility protein PilT
MARIDQLIQTLHQHKGQCLTIASGEKVCITVGNQPRPLSDREATAQQVQAFLREIAPEDLESHLAATGKHSFLYNAPAAAVQVQVARGANSLGMQVTLAAREAQPTAAPPPATAATPVQPAAPPAAAPPAPAAPVAATAVTSASPDAPAIEVLFQKMVDRGCSDLHMSTGNPPLFRKDGEIITLDDDTNILPERMREILMEITPERNRKEFEETCDSDFSYEMSGARFRCNLFMDRLGPGGVFRIIPSDIPTFEDLNLPKSLLKLCHLNKGLVVVTGPTGSGKSTTLAAMIDYINTNLNAHIITIEDPVEFVHPKRKCLINQREVHVHTQGFKNALRAALREDPDIVLVGEMRDLETVAIAIETAETGHLVFGTLHTNTAPSTVDRIIDQFPADRQAQVRTMLAESLKGVVAQTLCKKIGGGRVAALEVLLVTSAISNLIREGKTFQIPSIMQTGRGLGMVTLTDGLLELVKKKQVEPEQAYIKAVHKSELEVAFKRNNIRFKKPSEEGSPGTPDQQQAAAGGTEA